MLDPETDDTLLTKYMNAAIDLGTVCSKYLKIGWNVHLKDLRIGPGINAVRYNGVWVDIKIITDTRHGSADVVLSFCSDHIPELHMPTRVVITDGSEVRLAYNLMTRAYENWKYTFLINKNTKESL